MLELAGVDSFHGRAQCLHDIGFRVGEGEVAALLGRNGAGKSTTLKSIMQLLRPARGTITFNGQNLVGMPAHGVSRLGIGYVPEERRIFSALTVLENLEVGRQPARAGLAPWTVEELFTLFPNLAERRDNLGGTLSGGEQQMLTVARTLMGNPRLVLMDEPSEGIAPIVVEQMVAALKTLRERRLTILLSEQNIPFARALAERALVIESGRLRFDGTFAALDANPDLREKTLAV